VRGYRQGENPARWKGHLDKLLAAGLSRKNREHHPALPYQDINAFMASLREQPGTAARALEFTILAAARTGEVIGAKPEEIDVPSALWTIPGARMKAGKEHRVPLCDRALQIVKDQLWSEYIFPGRSKGEPLSNMAMLQLLKRMNRSDLTTHGFRSTFKDWASESTNYPREVSEMALAHAIGDQVEAAYRRGDLFEKRRQMMDEWSRYCDMPKADAKVSPIRKKA
jgi:integrase